MHNPITRFTTALLGSVLATLVAAQSPQEVSLPALEKRLGQINTQLAELATYSLGSGIGAIGYRSAPHDTAGHLEWIEVSFGQTRPLDEVVLVPAIRRDALGEFQADGFPMVLRLVAGTAQDVEGKVIAEYTTRDELLPRIAPLVIPCRGVQASWIRIETSTLSRRAFDEKYVFQLSEILAFSGLENVALHKPVNSSAGKHPVTVPGWTDAYVVDGFLPYLMAVPGGERSVAYFTPPVRNNPVLAIDLGASLPLTGINLHAVEQSDTVPQAFAGDFGFPQILRIEGANEPAFSDAKGLAELHLDNGYQVGPILMCTFPETRCRYVRLIAVKPNTNPLYALLPDRMGFAEIEIFSGGRNVALHKPITGNFDFEDPTRPLSSLTDGLNFYGRILPVRDWLNQLAQRHELERERPLVVAEINRHYARQKATLVWVVRLAGLLAVAVVVIVLLDRRAKKRAVESTRKRIAADLHDELGADLHAIGLLSDVAHAAPAVAEKNELLERIRSLTERSGKAARHCTNMLEAPGLYGDLVDDMRRSASRILTDLHHEFEVVESEQVLHKLRARKRIDLLLFYQECLVNIIRHARATRAHTRLTTADGEIRLTLSDNGRGLNGKIPSSLQRRANLLGAVVEAGASDSNGARICLRLKIRRWGILK